VLLFPAIDILNGRAVRLRQGDFGDSTEYADDPLDAARRWKAEGARALHVVDLDGARAGRPRSIDHLSRICDAVAVPVQYGGGLRAMSHLQEALEAGAARVVIGTAAFSDPELLAGALERWPDRVAVAVDVRAGNVSTSGWTATTKTSAGDAIRELLARGVRSFVYTNIDRDGMLSGVDTDELASVAQMVADARLVYSGGIGSLGDLRALEELELPNLEGAIVGKALYERRFTLAEAEAAFGGRPG
jgi:phosphoribosylformimino-5-aminoimidazole carboxamide ribotide isomerase